MKIALPAGVFREALRKVRWVHSKNELDTVCISAEVGAQVFLSARSYDGTFARARITAVETVAPEIGMVCVSASKLDHVLSAVSESVYVQSKENVLLISASHGKRVELPTLDPPEFYHSEAGDQVAQVDAPALFDALRKVAYATSKDEMRPVLTGVLFDFRKEKLTLVATDGYRMATSELSVSGAVEGQYVVPRVNVRGIFSLSGTASISPVNNVLLFSSSSVEIISPLISGPYPDYKAVYPERFVCTARVKREALLRSVRFASVMDKVITVAVSGNAISVSAKSSDGSAEDAVEAEISGSITCVFNASYIIEALSALPDEEVVLKFSGEVTPLVLEAGAFTYLLMPVVR